VSITTYYTATSLDGFIADEQHSLEWLFRQDQDEAGPLNYDEFFARIGAAVMGSTTYEWILRHEDGRWPYQLPSWVMTSRDLPKVDGDVRFARGEVRSVHEAMTVAPGGKACGSSGAVTWPASPPAPVCSTRSSCASRR
jgi:dihydrofolate reductase